MAGLKALMKEKKGEKKVGMTAVMDLKKAG